MCPRSIEYRPSFLLNCGRSVAIRKLQVFLSSRFDDFIELRAAIARRLNTLSQPPVVAVDLNDHRAATAPPISRCYDAIDGSEVFVLLLGETYGEPASTADERSYVHLEYARALEDPSKVILPYIATTYFDRRHSYDARLCDLADEVTRNHLAGRLLLELDPELSASTIYEAVLERLWEIYADAVDAPEVKDEELREVWDESPIKRDLLKESSKIRADVSRTAQPLRALAANHGREAFEALTIGLRPVAIHHLREAVKLVPLDFVLSYWLARLLIATGRRQDCKEGFRLAIQCSRIAEADEEVPELAQMAAYILAARANERFEENDAALEFAQAAHDTAPYYWLAKVELGRQLAIQRRSNDAFRYATEAFWLRPTTIRQIETDRAFRELGSEYERFRTDLRRQVESEVHALVAAEDTIVAFFAHLRGTAASPPPADGASQDVGRRPSVLRLVETARISGRHALELLQECASRLLTDVASFQIDPYRGISAATRDAIQKAQRDAKKELNQRQLELEDIDKTLKETQQTLEGSIAANLIVFAVIVLAALIAAAVRESNALAWVLAVVAAGALWIGWLIRGPHRRRREKAEGVARALRKLLKTNTEMVDLLAKVRAHFDEDTEALRENVNRFCELVRTFERKAGGRGTIAPAASPFRQSAAAGGILRLDAQAIERMGLPHDDELLPEILRFVAESSTPVTSHWFARVIKINGIETISRSAAYFPQPKPS